MLLAQASFIPHYDHEEAELVAVAEAYLVSMQKNGQICGDYVKGWSEDVLVVYARLSHRTAAQSKYLSSWGQRDLSNVRLQFGAEPEWQIIDDNISQPVPTWNSASSLYLFTHSLTPASPVHHGDRATPLPLHLLPLNDRLREELYFWQQSYACFDRLWLDGESLESTAYSMLTDCRSELTEKGRRLCTEIEAAVSKPVYYYLLHHHGAATDRRNRLCPGCEGAWLAEKSPLPSTEPFHKFHFRCEPCRLVSHCAAVPRSSPQSGDIELVLEGRQQAE